MVIVKIRSGLGNQLFQYAYARALKERGYNVYLDFETPNVDVSDDYSYRIIRETTIQRFNISLDNIDVMKSIRFRYVRKKTRIDREIFELARIGLWPFRYFDKDLGFSDELYNPPKECYIEGCFQNIKYFACISDILLQELTLKDEIIINQKLKRVLEQDNTVSLHVRRGDYIRHGLELPALYYKRAIQRMKEHYKAPHLLIFSDDVEWVRKNLKPDMECDFVDDYGSFRDYEQLVLMSMCKSNIISNSTFSWWGAWLNRNSEKVVIAPTKWIGEQRDLALECWEIV